jgi:hypothetical protein
VEVHLEESSARISTGGRIVFERGVGYSLSFEDSFIDTFNAQSNLVVRFPVGKVTPYIWNNICHFKE